LSATAVAGESASLSDTRENTTMVRSTARATSRTSPGPAIPRTNFFIVAIDPDTKKITQKRIKRTQSRDEQRR
jgi:hypothetical protein